MDFDASKTWCVGSCNVEIDVVFLILFNFFFFCWICSVMYILCNEEPLWMNLCLQIVKGPLQYKGSWKKTALHLYVSHSVVIDKHKHYILSFACVIGWFFYFLRVAKFLFLFHFGCSEHLPSENEELRRKPLQFDGNGYHVHWTTKFPARNSLFYDITFEIFVSLWKKMKLLKVIVLMIS